MVSSMPPQSTHKLIRTQATEWAEIDLNEKPLRRICKLANVSAQSKDEDVREFYESLPMFGPFYKGNESLMSTLKEAAWEHIVKKFPTLEWETNESYLSPMRRIEKLARNTYAEEDDEYTLDDMRRTEFQWMMIKDGCFILQLALFVLGGSTALGHPPDHLVFGRDRNVTARVKKWIKSIFFVGNQIPLVVLKELMKQSFFQDVISNGNWVRPPDLFRRTLYDLLVLPEQETMHKSSCKRRWQFLYRKMGLFGEDRHRSLLLKQKPSDLLHGLHLLVLGPTSDSSVAKYEDYAHLEDLELEFEGEDFGAGSNTIRGATELRQAGIHFKNAKGIGLSGIKFTTNVFRAVLTLPTFTVDDDTELVFRYLRNYETTQPLGINNREVSSYTQFMSELIRTPDDAKLLASHGIIRANRRQKEKLPGILNKLAAGDTNQNLRIIRLQIDEYSRPPWGRIRNFLSLVLLLTVVQTIYTILGYYKKSDQ